MKQIIEYFGGTIIAVLVAGCVMSLFSTLPMNLGNHAEMSLVMVQPKVGENYAFREYQTMPKWEISVKENYFLQTGIEYEVVDFLTVTDPEGVEREVWFLIGWHEETPEVKMQVTDEGKIFSCSHPGVYLVTLGGHSASAGYYETQIRLLVNGEVTA